MLKVQFNDAPAEVQNLVLQADAILLRVFAECCSLGQHDVVIDLERLDSEKVTVSVFDREQFREVLITVDPTNPFIDKLKQSYGLDGFWVSIRMNDDHYIYPILSDKATS